MSSINDIEKVLVQIGDEWPRDDSFVECVLRETAQHSQFADVPARTRRRMHRAAQPLIGIAASLAIAGFALWILGSGTSLYAQVTAAVHQARTLQMVHYVLPPEGERTVVHQAWYQRNVGYRVETADRIQLGNHEHVWTYEKSSATAVRSAAHGIDKALSPIFSKVEELASQLDNEFVRDPTRDADIDGDPCHAYRLTNYEQYTHPKLQQGNMRLVVYLDSEKRLKRSVTEMKHDGHWIPVFIDWKYDKEIDPSLFEAEFGDAVTLVDADEAFARTFDPATAIHAEERDGLIYAIHEISRFDDNGVYFVSSVRGTEETLAEFPPTKREMQPGVYVVDGPASYTSSPQVSGNWQKKIPGCHRLELASASHQGVKVTWWVMIPRSAPGTFEFKPGFLRFKVGVTPQGEFAQARHRDAEGVVHHINWDLTLAVAEQDAIPTFDEIAKRIHADHLALESVPFNKYLSIGDCRKVRNTSAIEITAEEHGKAARELVRSWQALDKEWKKR